MMLFSSINVSWLRSSPLRFLIGSLVALTMASPLSCLAQVSAATGNDAATSNTDANPTTPKENGRRRELIASVDLVGLRHTKDYKIQQYIHSRQDREFDPEVLQQDVKRLNDTHLFSNVKTTLKRNSEGVAITFVFYERARINYIKHLFNVGISERALLKEHGLKIGDPLAAFNVDDARRKLEELYHRKGYPKASVSILEGNKSSDLGVVFLINEGQIQRIASVSFEGNSEVVSDQRLKTMIESKPGYAWYFFGGKVDRDKIEDDVEKLVGYYRSLGYFKARVSRDLELDESGKWLNLKFIIDEGPRYSVRNIEITGMSKFEPQKLVPFLKSKTSRAYNQFEMQSDVNTITDLYGSQGHVFANVTPKPRFDEEPGMLDLVFDVEEGEKFHVGDINVKIKGDYPHTKRTVVLNYLNLRHGDIIDNREVARSKAKLSGSQLFIVNPSEGQPPEIVVRPPNLDSISGTATKPRRGSTIRGQSESLDEANDDSDAAPVPPPSIQKPTPLPLRTPSADSESSVYRR